MPALESLGLPVEVPAIGKELKKLWSTDQTRTRATLFNFAIVCEGTAAMQESTDLLQRFVGSHAFRALLIGVEPGGDDVVKAWINAHCYLPKAGAKHVCSEQISLYVRGNVRALLPNLLFSQLDYDIPLTLWWRCPSAAHADPEIWRWVDRLIFDTAALPGPRRAIEELRHQIGAHRTTLCDLAWTRTLHLRQALAQVFDSGEMASGLREVRRVRIVHAPRERTAAVLLLGWLAAQLGWAAHGPSGNHVRFDTGRGGIICDLTAEEGPPVARVELAGAAWSVTGARHNGSPYLHFSVEIGGRTASHLMPADSDDLTGTLNEELASWGRHRVYLKALAAAAELL